MSKFFGTLPSGEEAALYTISCGQISVSVTNYGASLVSVLVPDRDGKLADVVLGYDDANGYRTGDAFLGAVVGRNCNCIKDARFPLNGKTVQLAPNEGSNSLHSGPDCFHLRMWDVVSVSDSAITLALYSPNGDQGFPGNADIRVTYALEPGGILKISYDALCDKDTVFNMTNHSYFNLAGHDQTDAAMDQILTLPGRFFNPDDAESIPTGLLQDVAGTPMDFRTPKPIGRDINADFEPLHLQGGFDHNWEVFTAPCAILEDPRSGRTMAVITDRPGIQFYAGNFLNEDGKGGVHYGKRSGIALETQYYPDSLNHPEWPRPITAAGERYHSETIYKFN